jgi:hypothetical protein
MVMGMSVIAHRHRIERLSDASVVTAAVDIAGARHEVLPPRRNVMGGLIVTFTSHAAPP